MRALLQAIPTAHTPDTLAAGLRGEPGVVLLHSSNLDAPQARYSFVAARPFLTLRSLGSRCELHSARGDRVVFGNPWQVLADLLPRYELPDATDLPFPLGGCCGFWGYDLKNFLEPKLPRRAVNDLDLPDCHLGFYDSLVVFDHQLDRAWLVSTGLREDGSCSEAHAQEQAAFWRSRLCADATPVEQTPRAPRPVASVTHSASRITSSFSRSAFLAAVDRAQRYIRAGDIYQVNLAHRVAADWPLGGWELYQNLSAVSAAPFSAYLDCGDFQIASSSPELFLRLSGSQVLTRPIKGTRPRSPDATRDAQLAYELQTSPKEMAELVMITDLLRNDLGRVCEFGSVQVPDLARLERYAQVQHLVSTVEGRLRPDVTHLDALAACFPGGSITGAPKIRAMEIIDELEPVARGPYTGALGYLGFNRESQLSIVIRTAICKDGTAYFPVGAGIVADSQPQAEYDETLAKAGGFFAAFKRLPPQPSSRGPFRIEQPASRNARP